MSSSTCIISGLAAVSASFIMHPVDTLRNRMYLYGELTPNARPSFGLVPSIIANEGFSGFYNGISATVLRQGLFSATRFSCNDTITKRISHDGTLPIYKKIAVSTVAGTVGSLASCPAEVSLIRMQVDGSLPSAFQRRYTDVVDAIGRIMREEGVGGLYRGVKMQMLRGGIVTAGQFTTYDAVKSWLVRKGMDARDSKMHLMAAAVSGLVGAVAVNPIDLVRARLMHSSHFADGVVIKRYSSEWDCVRRTFNMEGTRGFFKGVGASVLRQCPQVILMWVLYEKYQHMYAHMQLRYVSYATLH